MVDIHTHVIPCVDDGSHSIEESLAMIKHEISIGVDTIICTPHHIYHRYEKSVEEITKQFNLLKEAVEKVKEYWTQMANAVSTKDVSCFTLPDGNLDTGRLLSDPETSIFWG